MRWEEEKEIERLGKSNCFDILFVQSSVWFKGGWANEITNKVYEMNQNKFLFKKFTF